MGAFLGPEYSNINIEQTLKEIGANFKSLNQEELLNYTAEKIDEGKAIGWFQGKMEFGPRALGNRSIIANPKDAMILHTINKYVKVRDFWMPFAPSIISEKFKKYIDSKKKIEPIFMTHSCDTTLEGKANLLAATHPFDRTARPQMVIKKFNKNFHNLIKEFEKISGVGAVLNTSFNLHGEPIVESPQDALRTLKKSGLKYLYIDEYLIEKK